MDQDQIEIITVNDRNSAEIEKPAGAAVGEAFDAHEGSKEADSGSQPQNLNYTSDAQEVQAGESKMTFLERHIRSLAKLKGLEPTQINLWKVGFEECLETNTRLQNRIYKVEEEMRSVKNEIYQVVGFFSAFQGLLITAAAQSILLRCNNVGFILALSAFAMAVAVFGIWQKITAMEKLRSASNCDIRNKKENLRWMEYLRHSEDSRINFDFRLIYIKSNFSNYSCTSWKEILVNVGTWLVVSVIAFGGLCMVVMRQIVCNPGHSLPSN